MSKNQEKFTFQTIPQTSDVLPQRQLSSQVSTSGMQSSHTPPGHFSGYVPGSNRGQATQSQQTASPMFTATLPGSSMNIQGHGPPDRPEMLSFHIPTGLKQEVNGMRITESCLQTEEELTPQEWVLPIKVKSDTVKALVTPCARQVSQFSTEASHSPCRPRSSSRLRLLFYRS